MSSTMTEKHNFKLSYNNAVCILSEGSIIIVIQTFLGKDI